MADKLRWSRPQIMGIVNINDDSFSGDGTLDVTQAFALAEEMIKNGADIVDVGSESARTNREAITAEEEIGRLLPFIERFDPGPGKTLLSINTWRPEVVKAVLETGKIDIINDISGLPNPSNAGLCAEHDAMLLIMHTVGDPKVPHLSERYDDIWSSLEDFFSRKIQLATDAGMKREQIILDPGIDFAKQLRDNLSIYRHLERLHQFKLPILLPISRKTVIGEVLNLPNPAERDAGTLACLARGVRAGMHIYRVHNVKAASDSLKVLQAIESPSS